MRSFTICTSCSKLNRGSSVPAPGSLLGTMTCKAFPQGIPLKIWDGGFDHRLPLHGETELYEMEPGFEGSLQAYEHAVASGWFNESEDAGEENTRIKGPRRPPTV